MTGNGLSGGPKQYTIRALRHYWGCKCCATIGEEYLNDTRAPRRAITSEGCWETSLDRRVANFKSS